MSNIYVEISLPFSLNLTCHCLFLFFFYFKMHICYMWKAKGFLLSIYLFLFIKARCFYLNGERVWKIIYSSKKGWVWISFWSAFVFLNWYSSSSLRKLVKGVLFLKNVVFMLIPLFFLLKPLMFNDFILKV